LRAIDQVRIDVGAGNDHVEWLETRGPIWQAASIAGGAGNDTLTGAAGADTLDGQDGDDNLAG
ncbi:MAG: hypothetical protein M3478_04640, partial [Planctomycetota bacterium]|nr:hypothetical protein [Planctomycetota bacterium]